MREVGRVVTLDLLDLPGWTRGIVNHHLLHLGWNRSVIHRLNVSHPVLEILAVPR
jgi:hypothetical protein